MMEALVIVALVSLVVAFEVLAPRSGADSRDGNDWVIHRRV